VILLRVSHSIPIFILLISLQASAWEDGWKLRHDKSGISVYTREHEGSPFLEFRGVMSLPGTSVGKILGVIRDIDRYNQLIPDCIESRILMTIDSNHFVYYMVIRAPVTIRNRDAIYESIITESEDGRYALVGLRPAGSFQPEKEGLVRIYKGAGFWELQAVPGDTVTVTYQFLPDPGGGIPAWMVNSAAVSNPVKTLTNLKARVNGR
jgi:hypothetical protein